MRGFQLFRQILDGEWGCTWCSVGLLLTFFGVQLKRNFGLIGWWVILAGVGICMSWIVVSLMRNKKRKS
jgi:hypothetical protein